MELSCKKAWGKVEKYFIGIDLILANAKLQEVEIGNRIWQEYVETNIQENDKAEGEMEWNHSTRTKKTDGQRWLKTGY